MRLGTVIDIDAERKRRAQRRTQAQASSQWWCIWVPVCVWVS